MLDKDESADARAAGTDNGAQAFSADDGDAGGEDGDSRQDGSLADDISALIDDSKTYIEAEIAFQKTRLSFAANRSKSGIGFILGALAFLHLALIALVVGAIISLIPIAGPVGATLLVVGTLLIATAMLLWLAKGKFASLSDAFRTDEHG